MALLQAFILENCCPEKQAALWAKSQGRLMPCPFTGPKCFGLVQIFWASPKIWLHLVPLQKCLCWHKKQFYWMQIICLSGTKYLWLPQYVNEFLVWHKKFGPAQNILGPVKGQVITLEYFFQNLKQKLLLCVNVKNEIKEPLASYWNTLIEMSKKNGQCIFHWSRP